MPPMQEKASSATSLTDAFAFEAPQGSERENAIGVLARALQVVLCNMGEPDVLFRGGFRDRPHACVILVVECSLAERVCT